MRDDQKAARDRDYVFNQCRAEVGQMPAYDQGVADVVTAERPEEGADNTNDRRNDQTPAGANRCPVRDV